MTRADEIAMLRNQYRIYIARRKHKSASFVLLRLFELMQKQLKAEIRLDRKENAA